MRLLRWLLASAVLAFPGLIHAADRPEPTYVRKDSRVATVLASLKASGLPTLDGPWHFIGPFDNAGNRGFDTAYPPEKEIDLKKTYRGRRGREVGWEVLKDFQLGKVVNLARFRRSSNSVVYLYHEIDSAEALRLPLSLGSDDTLTVWLNGRRILAENVVRAAAPDQNHAVLKLLPGKNRLLIKVGNAGGEFAVYVAPEFPPTWPGNIRKRLDRDFPPAGGPSASLVQAEAKHYRIATIPVPPGIVLEVGGLAFRPDGKLLACTRRGDVWLISRPTDETPGALTFKKFAEGLHEPLGLLVEGKDVYVTQRPELTRLRDTDDDDVADDLFTVCDKWGVSGDYHEFAFGPARHKGGNFYVTLNVGFGGGHQSKAPWRGWCVEITPDGKLTPFATGLRSPNGVRFSPEGDLFYCDNQGEWVETNKMHHIRRGDFFGHQAGLRWVPQSPFRDVLKTSYKQGMLYDGQRGGFPEHTPPCIWFPYGRMGQSVSEPIWDTTGGKFGPFAGQCFVGDQTRSSVMRVYLEKINGRYQGACFPFRSGFQCGINRLAFAPDGSLFAGQTNRGWGSIGGKSEGLQRLIYTGVLPFEVHSMKLTRTGFDLTFTKPVDAARAGKASAYGLQSFTYIYSSHYGSAEVDRRAEKVSGVKVSADRRTVSLAVPDLRRGRLYELRIDDVPSADGDGLLHSEAYYTLNELP
jgi:hypothetical protein